MNTIANHGLIPRSGRNISTEDVIFGLSRGLNVARDIAVMASTNAIQLNPARHASTFDLHMLSRHNAIEHDNSLTRADAYFGDNESLDPTVLDQTLSFLPNQVISLDDAAIALTGRIRHSQRTNPEFAFDLFGSTSTTASYLAVLGDSEKGEAVRAWVKYLFGMYSGLYSEGQWRLTDRTENEKLPFELGWVPRSPAYDLDTLQSLSDKVTALLPDDLRQQSQKLSNIHVQEVLEFRVE